MESFWRWLHSQLPKASPGLALHGALEYAIWCWPYMMNVLEDGRLELDNNIAERAIKPFVISRNNWLFCSSKSGAEASAGIYSIVTTARANGLDNERHIEWLLTEMPNAGELTDEVVDGFLAYWVVARQARAVLGAAADSGSVFSAQAGSRLRTAALAFGALALAELAFSLLYLACQGQPLLPVNLGFGFCGFPADWHALTAGGGGSAFSAQLDVTALVVSCFLWGLSHAFEHGARLQLEQDATI